ncbi:hypothetical protein RvY_15531-2 [Ramazzottius varieornatus]|uniref:Peptidase S1 domain-containing protein n=1 Tax=Ramazzottius varieornatus TaxID=947166 RepID=A0A1D1VVA2_RAMVA|nr:hypothetical protein RvY_15531-2 [Ramazzottius varieornatus]
MSASQFQIVVGAIDNGAPDTNANDPTGCAQTFEVQSITAHPDFNYELNNNDVAIITLASAIDLSSKTCACTLCLKNRQPNVEEKCIVSGYGFDNANLTLSNTPIPLKWVAQTIISEDDVAACPVFANAAGTAETDTSLFICAGGSAGQDSCLEDQGGALACFDPTTSSHYAAGLLSFGSETCGAGLGGQNTKLPLYLSWIQQNALVGDVVISDTGTVTPAPGGSTTPAPPSGEGCGLPGNGAVDPFGIVSQFKSKRRLSSVHRMNLNGRRKERIRGAPRIIGGFDTTATVICWQAYVVVDLPANGGQISCGGIIIGSRTILASASCLLDLDANPVVASSIFVTVGAMDSGAPTTNANDPTGCAQEYTVTRTITYPTFQYPTSDDDLALLILSEAIDLQGKPCACTICLPNRIPAVGETCVMSGYGNEIANSSGK